MLLAGIRGFLGICFENRGSLLYAGSDDTEREIFQESVFDASLTNTTRGSCGGFRDGSWGDA